MKITCIEKKKGSQYTVYVDDAYFYILNLEIIADNNLKAGMEVDEEFLDGLKQQAEARKARERAFYLLSYRDHSQKELYDKLCKHARPEIAAATVAKMLELNLLDDARYAGKLAEYYLNQKHWSYRKSLFEMKSKGIDRETAEESLQECQADPVEQITQLIDTKYYRYLGDFKGNQKVINAIARLGFGYSDIKTAIHQYIMEKD